MSPNRYAVSYDIMKIPGKRVLVKRLSIQTEEITMGQTRMEKFMKEALVDFELYLAGEKNLAPKTREFRVRGAQLFVEFLFGRKYAKYEHVK